MKKQLATLAALVTLAAVPAADAAAGSPDRAGYRPGSTALDRAGYRPGAAANVRFIAMPRIRW